MDRYILKQKLIEWFEPIDVMQKIAGDSITYDVMDFEEGESIIFHPVYIMLYDDDFSVKLFLHNKDYEKCINLINNLVMDQDPHNYRYVPEWSLHPQKVRIDIQLMKYNESNVSKLFELLNSVIMFEEPIL